MRGGSKYMFQELIWTRRRVLIAYCLRRGVCSDSKCCTSCRLRNVMDQRIKQVGKLLYWHECRHTQIRTRANLDSGDLGENSAVPLLV